VAVRERMEGWEGSGPDLSRYQADHILNPNTNLLLVAIPFQSMTFKSCGYSTTTEEVGCSHM